MTRKITIVLEGDFDAPDVDSTETNIDMVPNPMQEPFSHREITCIRGSLMIAADRMGEFAT